MPRRIAGVFLALLVLLAGTVTQAIPSATALTCWTVYPSGYTNTNPICANTLDGDLASKTVFSVTSQAVTADNGLTYTFAAATVTSVDLYLLTAARSMKVKLRDASGTLLYESSTISVPFGAWYSFTPTSPVSGATSVEYVIKVSSTNTHIADVRVMTDVVPVVPGPPQSLQAVGGANQVALTWSAPVTGDPATGYQVRRNGVLVGSPVVASYTDTGLVAASEYTYLVRATNEAGSSSDAGPVTATTDAEPPPPPLEPPTTPADLAAAPGDATVFLTWSAATGTVTGYRLYRDAVQIYQGTELGFEDFDLVNDQAYLYTVLAFNASGSSALSVEVTGTPGGVTLTQDARILAELQRHYSELQRHRAYLDAQLQIQIAGLALALAAGGMWLVKQGAGG